MVLQEVHILRPVNISGAFDLPYGAAPCPCLGKGKTADCLVAWQVHQEVHVLKTVKPNLGPRHARDASMARLLSQAKGLDKGPIPIHVLGLEIV